MGALTPPLVLLGRLNGALAAVFKYLSLTLVAVMTLVILLQVFFRYVLNDALSWSEEAARYMMVWMTFLVAPIAYRKGWNVAIDMLSDLLRGRARHLLQLLLDLAVMVVLVAFMVVLLEDRGILQRGWGRIASAFEIQMFWIYLAMPVGVGAMILVGVELILDSVRHLIRPAAPGDAHAPHDASHTAE